MKKENNKKSASALIGAAFLMATSAIGPGFLTQTGKFTDSLHGSFGFVILISVILAAIVQLNVWRVLCVSGMRGQDVANKVLPGLGYLIAFLVVALRDNQLANYWTSSGTYDSIFNYIKGNIADVRNDIVLMVAGERVPAKMQQYAATANDLYTKDQIYSAMVVYGLLTYEELPIEIPRKNWRNFSI